MHLNWIDVVADAAELLAGGLAVLFCCLGVRSRRVAQVSCQDLVHWYPDLDRELDMVWQRYRR